MENVKGLVAGAEVQPLHNQKTIHNKISSAVLQSNLPSLKSIMQDMSHRDVPVKNSDEPLAVLPQKSYTYTQTYTQHRRQTETTVKRQTERQAKKAVQDNVKISRSLANHSSEMQERAVNITRSVERDSGIKSHISDEKPDREVVMSSKKALKRPEHYFLDHSARMELLDKTLGARLASIDAKCKENGGEKDM